MIEQNRNWNKEAGRKALECCRKGFPCGESVLATANETKIADPTHRSYYERW